MKKIFWVLGLFLIPSLGFSKVELRVGDILLQPLSCWSCTLIEEQEETIYSHVGFVISLNPVMVAEALSSVRVLPLEAYRARNEAGLNLKVLRYRDFRVRSKLKEFEGEFVDIFYRDFFGKKYDHDFLWDNVDELGQEKIYCSELITKLFEAFGVQSVPVKVMLFDKNPEAWERYFRGSVPRGEVGNSPGDFERSDLFFVVGEI
jgi:hypothetical protein